MEKQSLATRFERAVLFKITRFLALAICIFLFLGTLGSGIYVVFSFRESVEAPSPHSVVEDLLPEVAATGPTGRPGVVHDLPQMLKGLRLDPVVQQLISTPERQKWLYQSLLDLPESQRQECADGMGQALAAARPHRLDEAKVVVAYMGRCQEYARDLERAAAESLQKKIYMAGSFATLLILTALFSLVLVLLAIEKNTRPLPIASESK